MHRIGQIVIVSGLLDSQGGRPADRPCIVLDGPGPADEAPAYYADRVGQLPLGVIGAAVGTAMLPLLSRQVRAGESLSAHRTMNRAAEMSLLLCLPAAVGQAVVAVGAPGTRCHHPVTRPR